MNVTEAITPNTDVEVIYDWALRPQIPKWPDGFRMWPNVQEAHRRMLRSWGDGRPPPLCTGRGIVTAGGGPKHFTALYIMLTRLRELGCKLPVEVWYLGEFELSGQQKELLRPFNVRLVNGLRVGDKRRILNGWELKPHAVLHSAFEEVLWLDADCVPVVDPTPFFEWPQFKAYDAVFWPDFPTWTWTPKHWETVGLPCPKMAERCPRNEVDGKFGKRIPIGYPNPIESGAIMLRKTEPLVSHALRFTSFLCDHSEYWFDTHNTFHGDKDMFYLAWHWHKLRYAMPWVWPGWDRHTMLQHDFSGRVVFHHRTMDKTWTYPSAGIAEERRYFEIRAKLDAMNQPSPMAEDLNALAGRYVYTRVRHDERTLELLRGGGVGEGKAGRESRWTASPDGNTIQIFGADNRLTCELHKRRNTWFGSWVEYERMSIVLRPIGEPFMLNPQLMAKHAGRYMYHRQPRPCSDAKIINDRRSMALLDDSNVVEGRSNEEAFWDVREYEGYPVLTFYNASLTATAHLTQNVGDDVWRGQYINGTKCPVDLRRIQ